MGTITSPFIEAPEKEELRQKAISKAIELLTQHGVHNGLGIPQEKVSWLRRKKDLDIKNALFVLFHAGKITIDKQ